MLGTCRPKLVLATPVCRRQPRIFIAPEPESLLYAITVLTAMSTVSGTVSVAAGGDPSGQYFYGISYGEGDDRCATLWHCRGSRC